MTNKNPLLLHKIRMCSGFLNFLNAFKILQNSILLSLEVSELGICWSSERSDFDLESLFIEKNKQV